jgi:hypothetical protein
VLRKCLLHEPRFYATQDRYGGRIYVNISY